MKQYLDLCNRIVNEGKWVANERTGKRCLTVINADLTYNVENGEFPLVTTRRSFWKAAIAELLGYIRGYSNAADFRALGTKSWDANANENTAWLNNPYRKGEDDMGLVYGAIGRNFPKPNGGSVDLLRQIVDDLKRGIDNRGEIYTFYHPGALPSIRALCSTVGTAWCFFSYGSVPSPTMRHCMVSGCTKGASQKL